MSNNFMRLYMISLSMIYRKRIKNPSQLHNANLAYEIQIINDFDIMESSLPMYSRLPPTDVDWLPTIDDPKLCDLQITRTNWK